MSLHVEHLLLPVASNNMGMAQVVECIPSRRAAQVSAISPPGQPRVQLMLPAAKELAAKAAGRGNTGMSGLKHRLVASRKIM